MDSIVREDPRPVEELVSFVAPSSLEADQYRMLRHVVERFHQDEGHQVFGITSAAGNQPPPMLPIADTLYTTMSGSPRCERSRLNFALKYDGSQNR